MNRRRERKEQLARLALAREEVTALLSELHRVNALFDAVADPALTEAAILELGALRQRYGNSLREYKALSARWESSQRNRKSDRRRPSPSFPTPVHAG